MFKLFERKIQWVILPVITVILLVMTGSVYHLISGLLRDDFMMKSEDFSNRIARGAQKQMEHMMYNVRLYLNKTDLAAGLRGGGNRINANILSEVKNYNPNIRGAVLLGTDGWILASNSYYYGELAPALLQRVRGLDGPAWILVEAGGSAHRRQSLFLVLPVSEERTDEGCLAVEADTSMFGPSINTDNLFLRGATIFFSDGDGAVTLIGEEPWSAKDRKEQENQNKSMVCRIPVWENSGSLVFHIPMTILKRQLRTALAGLLLFFLICVVGCGFSLRRMVLHISNSLKRVSDKMDEEMEKIVN